MVWDEEEIIPSNNFWSNNTSTIFLRLGVYDEVGSELLYQNFKYAPDFVQSFLKWVETDNARVTMLEGALKIEIKPDMGKLHVLGYPSLENLTEFLKVMLNPSKVKLPLLQIQGGIATFNAFTHAASMDDNHWDINFMTSFKYLVGKYNDYAKKVKWPVFEMRHSLLETTKSQDQNIYNNDPTYFITRIVSLFDRLETNIHSPQYSQQIENSIIKTYYPNLQGLSTTYHQYIDILQDAINMLVPPEIRGEKRYKEDIRALAPFLLPMFPNYIADTDQYLQLLYQSILAKKSFPWIDQQHEDAFLMLDLSYDIIQLQEIDNGQFGKDLQLTATAIYFLFFTVGKLYPHLKMVEEEIMSLFSEALLEMVNNFNPLNLQSHQKDQWGFNKLHSLFVFIEGLQEGYINPYNDYFPEVPDFIGPKPLDSILKELPNVPMHTPEIFDDDVISIDAFDDLNNDTKLYPDVSADKERYKNTKLYPDLQSPRHRALADMDQKYIEFINSIDGEVDINHEDNADDENNLSDVSDVPLSNYEKEDFNQVIIPNNQLSDVSSVSLSEYEETDFNQGIVPNNHLSDVSDVPLSEYEEEEDLNQGILNDISAPSEYEGIGDYNQNIIPQTPPQTPLPSHLNDLSDYLSDVTAPLPPASLSGYISDVTAPLPPASLSGYISDVTLPPASLSGYISDVTVPLSDDFLSDVSSAEKKIFKKPTFHELRKGRTYWARDKDQRKRERTAYVINKRDTKLMLHRLKNKLPENLRIPNVRYDSTQPRTSNWRRLLKRQTGKGQKRWNFFTRCFYINCKTITSLFSSLFSSDRVLDGGCYSNY